jgi:hypothetical protein
MHSDGLSPKWGFEQIQPWVAQPAEALARRLLQELAKPTDDATVIVVKPKLS